MQRMARIKGCIRVSCNCCVSLVVNFHVWPKIFCAFSLMQYLAIDDYHVSCSYVTHQYNVFKLVPFYTTPVQYLHFFPLFVQICPILPRSLADKVEHQSKPLFNLYPQNMEGLGALSSFYLCLHLWSPVQEVMQNLCQWDTNKKLTEYISLTLSFYKGYLLELHSVKCTLPFISLQ